LEIAMKRRQILQTVFAISISALFASPAQAGKDPVYTGLVSGVGAGGYDVVAYFSGQSAPGKADITAQWGGATWRFANAENKAAFEASPEKYAPQYGGYCAYAVSKGATAKGDPEAWTVVDGKLYLNFSTGVRETWSQDIPGNISAANANWPKVLE
jgi:YHS domain-containing protein